MFNPYIIGHNDIREQLFNRCISGQLNKSMLFVGPNSIGKRRVALELAQRELCFNKNACGKCQNCIMFNDPLPVELPNLLRIAPEGKAGLIRIGTIRDNDLVDGGIIQWAHRTSSLNCHRWILIEDAHCLNKVSANMILKIIEEPPINTHFLLITNRLETMLPTICSRCERINFKPLDITSIWTIAKRFGWEETQKDLWITLSFGTLKYINNESFQIACKQINTWIAIMKGTLFSNVDASMLPQKSIYTSQAEQIRQSLEILLLLISDLHRCQNNQSPRLLPWLTDIQYLATLPIATETLQVKIFESLRNLIRNPNAKFMLRNISLLLQTQFN